MSLYEFQATYKDDDTCLFRLMHPPSRRVKSVYQLPDSFGSVPGVSASVLWDKKTGLQTSYLSFHMVELCRV